MNHSIEFIHEIDSTNSYLSKVVRERGQIAPHCVVTGSQTKGRGQRHRVWQSEPFKNILCSFLVQNVGPLEHLVKLNNAASLAVVQTLNEFEISGVSVKWPNDIFISDKKVSGILIENVIERQEVKYAIVGIGLNVNQSVFTGITATSMRLEKGVEIDYTAVLHSLYEAFYYFVSQSDESLLQSVNEILYKKGESVTFQGEERFLNYTIKRLLANGNLQVEDENGVVEIEHHRTKWLK